MALPLTPLTSVRGHAKNDSWVIMLGGGGGGCVSHPLQLTTELEVNSFIISNSHLGRWAYASYSLVSIRRNVFWLKQNFILRIREELDGTPVHGDYSVEFRPQQSVRSLFLKFNPADELSIRRYIRELNKTYCSLDPVNVPKITVAFEAAAPFYCFFG